MTETSLQEEKARLRAAARSRRAALSTADAGGQAAAAIFKHEQLASLMGPGAAIGVYWPLGSELDTRPLIALLHKKGARVGLPAVIAPEAPLAFRLYRLGDALVPAGHGSQAPPPEAEKLSPSLLFVPLLAADRAGFRIGYGGGYYDRTIASLRASGPCVAVGLCYREQIILRVPADERDERLDWLATEAGVFRCGATD